MATTYTPRSPMDEGAIGRMNDITTQFAAPTFPRDSMASPANSQLSPHINLSPPLNPPFTFPLRPSASASFSSPRSTGRRHQSAIDIPKIGLDVECTNLRGPSNALPEFCFNPGHGPENNGRRPKPPPLPDFSFNPADTPAINSSLLSPSFPPLSPRTAPGHMGHRRGGSEFVGGKLKSGEPITVMSTSPTRSEGAFGSPTLAPSSGPRKHQRGHSHRRSGAISSHDLSLILQKPPDHSPMTSSAPASPAGYHDHHIPYLKIEEITEATATTLGETATGQRPLLEKPSQSSPELSPRPATRARVGFSDTLEYIPRPLSVVSTDTASTVRPGHSVSGSVSSVASTTTSANIDRDSSVILASSVSHAKSGARPSTAGAVLERTSSLQVALDDSSSTRRRNSIPILNDIALMDPPTPSTSTPAKTTKRWSFFGLDSFATNVSPTRASPTSSSSSETANKSGTNIVVSPSGDAMRQDSGASQDVSFVDGKKPGKKRQRKVKSWAGSILTRKSKSRVQKSKAGRRSQTPPAPRFPENEDMDNEHSENADRLSRAALGSNLIQPVLSNSGTNKRRPTRAEDEMPYPMIDLDAALGPFNTPTRDPQWDEAQRSGATPKRQLHSAAGMRGFSGPGMHYHRRTESAPEMPPFEGGRLNNHRFGSSLIMADVFEEDEEDDSGDYTGESALEDSTSESQDATTCDEDEGRDMDDASSTPTQEYNVELVPPKADVPTLPFVKKEGCLSLELPAPGKLQNEDCPRSFQNEVIAEEQSSDFAAREIMLTTAPDPSGQEAHSHRRDVNQTESIPPDATSIILSGSLAIPNSPYSVTQSSSFPSPHSPMSYDAHRISTPPASATDEDFRSLLMGEPGPEVVRLSFEVPSLTSTNSITTRESNFMTSGPARNTPFYEQRPASFTTTAFGRRRSSLASLSRLISSAHGERSKLSMEVPCDIEEEKKSKPSRSKRLSKMIQFWKPKGTGSS
ncbi:hypothetical protein GGR50DRAFT_678426 [Xylaria sp. CBS 124048]|nr:hypothetical protein GGR50DRAFT_678426 [Xylaria sp. CBS 124048]